VADSTPGTGNVGVAGDGEAEAAPGLAAELDTRPKAGAYNPLPRPNSCAPPPGEAPSPTGPAVACEALENNVCGCWVDAGERSKMWSDEVELMSPDDVVGRDDVPPYPCAVAPVVADSKNAPDPEAYSRSRSR